MWSLLLKKEDVLEHQVKMKDTKYDAKILGRRTRVRMNESQYSYDAVSEGSSEDPRLLKNPSSNN